MGRALEQAGAPPPGLTADGAAQVFARSLPRTDVGLCVHRQGALMNSLAALGQAEAARLAGLLVLAGPGVDVTSAKEYCSLVLLQLQYLLVAAHGAAQAKSRVGKSKSQVSSSKVEVAQVTGSASTKIEVEVTALSLDDQKALAVSLDAATRDQELAAEISAVAEGESACVAQLSGQLALGGDAVTAGGGQALRDRARADHTLAARWAAARPLARELCGR